MSIFAEASHYSVDASSGSGAGAAGQFTEVGRELDVLEEGVGLVDRSERGRAQVTGGDRLPWLSNLVTNAVKTLDEGSGAYTFAADVKGRTQFDANVLVLRDELWLDLDARHVEAALRHLDMRLITEDVQLKDVSDQDGRLGVSGPGAAELVSALGAGQLVALPQLGHVPLERGARLVRHDFAGGVGAELIIPRADAVTWWDRLAELGAVPVGSRAVQLARVRAGIPVWGAEIDERVLPPETNQIERGISYHKGCYLGQEVIERMRSRGVVARRLVALRGALDAGGAPFVEMASDAAVGNVVGDGGAELQLDGANVGRVTSLVVDPRDRVCYALGYAKGSLTVGSLLMLVRGDAPALALEVAGFPGG